MNYCSTLVLFLLLLILKTIPNVNTSIASRLDSSNKQETYLSIVGGSQNNTTALPEVNAVTLETDQGANRSGDIFRGFLSLLNSINKPDAHLADESQNNSTLPSVNASTHTADNGFNEPGDIFGAIWSILDSINILDDHLSYGSQNISTLNDVNASISKIDDTSGESDDVFGAMLQIEKMFIDARTNLFLSGGPFSINQLLSLMGSLGFGQCLTDLSVVAESVKRREEWALNMIDSFGKPGTTLIHGNKVVIGDFDQCLDVVTGRHFGSQFCTAKIGILRVKDIRLGKPTGFLLGMCLPSSCDEQQIQDLINGYMWFNPDVSGGALEIDCKEQDRNLSTKAILAICICSMFLCMVLLGTACDVFCKMMHFLLMEGHDWTGLDDPMAQSKIPSAPGKCYFENQSIVDSEMKRRPIYSDNTADSVNSPKEKCQPTETLKQIFMAFSAYTNFSNLVSTDHPQGSITCINGLRVLSVSWIVVYHFISNKGRGIENYQTYLDKSYEKWSFMVVLASNIAVDTFFAISGILVSYLTLKKLAKKETDLTPRFFGDLYFHRFWRLTPVYMFILMISVTIYQYTYTGPGWMDDGFEKNQCEKTWWTNLLYINNFVYADEMCMEWTWYLSDDMQFYILSPLLFLPMFYYEWRGLVVPLAFLLGNAICTGVITSVNDLPVYQHFEDVPVGNRDVFWTAYYVKPYTRIGPYVIGTITGFLLYKCQCKARIPMLLVILGWVVATALSLVVIFGLSEHQTDDPLSADVAGLFNSLNRIAWGMSTCWVIFACANGYGGIANTFLSWKAFVPLARLSYCFYLIHPVVLKFFYTSGRRLFYMDNVSFTFGIMSVTVLAYGVSIIAYLVFEAPMAKLEMVFKAKRKEIMET